MNDLLEIKKSKIAGNGVFAIKKIARGQTICFFTGELCTLDEVIKRCNKGVEKPSDPLGVEDDEYLDLDEMSRTFNHSCNPNSFIRGKTELVALKDIKIGEEINYDYSTTMNDNKEKIEKAGRILWTCKCHCGSKNCRGIIDQFKTLPKRIQREYIKNKCMPDFMLKQFK
ncbi:MAG: SET domain-containing protein-lysine N-methyltransferase [Candidatus Woesearchaeota archaeon]|nr:SET domain-containing protein-lysine N-methyltransferase [Candidatus Woesearchaeota archaeon]